jgi:Leucine-rich repeat (LRR) protein
MILHSLAEVLACKQLVRGVVLRSSQDLLCTNLFCEKVSEPCVCRLDMVLSKKKLVDLKILDLSNNKLHLLPPIIGSLVQLEELNLSGNCLLEVPEFVLSLPKLKVLNISNNFGIRPPASLKDSHIDIIAEADSISG